MTLKQAPTSFAPAVTPVASTTIHTDTDGLHAGQTTIPSQGEDLPAYLARPENVSGKLPIILVVQEIFGVHEHIQDVCRRLAKQGYLAIAPELYFRQGDPRDYTEISELFEKLVSKVPDQQVLSDLDHTAHWASQHGGDISKLGITGFCWGGRIAWLYAAHNPQLKAGVAWYGKLVGNKTLTNPTNPVDRAAALDAPVLGLYGGQDTGIPLDTVETMRQAIRAANANAEIVVYPEAGHAFNADYRPSYNAEVAQDGWQRMLDFFAQYGVK
ncbi:dienelactone hydrolase family protein [Rahnella sikkimica]|uniref:Carboxymethylenebutenolidase n=1 Tax=Rahnella sikkimica TaxID=1805933 RepID=A0A2L1UUW4_9GAMM|nr:dienelactone hydrolase family protein [Rahnella sikkimica]AVF36725.1 carboxymethylenebutenolidase [Rahnella sikkimica]